MKRKSSTLLIFNLFVLKQIPGGGQISSKIIILFLKSFQQSRGFPDVVFKKLQSQIEMHVSKQLLLSI